MGSALSDMTRGPNHFCFLIPKFSQANLKFTSFDRQQIRLFTMKILSTEKKEKMMKHDSL